MEIESKFEHFCRICTIEHEVGIMIFSEEGEKMMLRDKITKYLHIEITTQDRLPKMICINCCTRLDSVKIFSDMALQSQHKLNKHLEILDLVSKNNAKNPSRPPVIHRYKYFQNSDKESNGDFKYQDDESDITEMELRLDPMMFLDCQTDESQSDDSFSDTSLKNISCKSEIPDLCSIEDQCEALTIELLPRVTVFKSERDKKVKALPDLKPINFTKKFSSLPDPIKRQNASTESCGLKPFVCAVCPRSFLSSIALQNHSWLHLKNKAKEHPGNGRVACPVCKKDISTKGNLKVHMETHRPKGKYNCEICGRIFKTQSNLYRHREYHGGEVFTCTVCGRVYPTNSTLRAHSITHSDARPHNCPLCKKTFKRNQDLKFHINQHTGARPYHCPYCPKAFASSGNCFSHRKRMHPVEVERDRDKSS